MSEINIEKNLFDEVELMSSDSKEKILNVVFLFTKYSEIRKNSDNFLKEYFYFIENLLKKSKNYTTFDKYIERLSNNAIENLIDKQQI